MPPSHPWASSSSMLDLVLPDGRTDPIPAPPFHRCFFPLIPGMMAELGLWPTTLWLVLRSLGMIGLWSVFSHSPSLLLLVQDIITCLLPIYSPAIAPDDTARDQAGAMWTLSLQNCDLNTSHVAGVRFSNTGTDYQLIYPGQTELRNTPDFSKWTAVLSWVFPDCLYCNNGRLLSEVDTSVKDCFEELYRLHLS